jgi:hypothetical protein
VRPASRIASAVVFALSGAAVCAQGDAPLKNWFNDPFFPLTQDIGQCPVPRGALMTEAEMKAESHSRIERGTTCWMSGRCKEPNAYLYDAGIGKAIRERFAGDPALRGTSLWITVKRRFVWVEGCVPDAARAPQLEAMFSAVPEVERVLVNVMQGVDGKPPYARLDESQK